MYADQNRLFLDVVLQNYRSSSKRVTPIKKKKLLRKGDFKTPVKIFYDRDENEWQFPNKEALLSLPPQVAFNLACILTKKRSQQDILLSSLQ